MASVMGRSCGSYGVHLLAYLPSAPSPSISSHLRCSLTRFNISFFPFFGSSSCRSRRFKLYAVPSSPSRSFYFCLHGEAEKTGANSRSVARSRQLSAKKRASSSLGGVDKGEGSHAPLNDLEQTDNGSSRPASRLRQLPAKKRAPYPEKEPDTDKTPCFSVVEAEKSIRSSKRSAPRIRTKKRASSLAKELNAGEEKSDPLAEAEGGSSMKSASPLRQPFAENQYLYLEKGLDKGNQERFSSAGEEQPGGTLICPPPPSMKPRKKRASSLENEHNTGEEVRFSSAETEPTDGSSVCSESPLRQPSRKKQPSSSSSKKELLTDKQEHASSSAEAEQSGSTSAIPSSSQLRHLPTKRRTSSLKKKSFSGDEGRVSLVVVEQSGAGSISSASGMRQLPAKMQAPSLQKEFVKGEQGHVFPVEADQTTSTLTSSAFPLKQPLTNKEASSLEKEFGTGVHISVSLIESEQTGGPSISSGPFLQEVPLKEQASFKKVSNMSKKVNAYSAESDKVSNRSKRLESRLRELSAKKRASSMEKDFDTGEQAYVSLAEPEEAVANSICSEFCLQQLPAEKGGPSLERELDSAKEVLVPLVEEVSSTKWTILDQVTSRKHMPHDTASSREQMPHGGALKREGIGVSNGIPIPSEKWESNNQQCIRWTKSTAHSGTEHATQKYETKYRQQVVTRTQRADSQQDYILANLDRAHGREQKKKKEFLVRNRTTNQASTISYIQIFGTGFDTGETVPTVLLFFDRRRFLFNVGEGLHRFCMEHKFKLSKIDHVFLTRVCSETVGGLPGLVLTLAEMNESGLTVRTWGPSSLDDLAQAMRVFVPSGWMEHINAFGPGANDQTLPNPSSSSPILLLEDELIMISAVLLSAENTADTRTPSISKVDKKNGSVLATVYICELSTVRGKFDPDRAQAKGLRPGYKYGKLQRGESVLSDDGTTMVHPADVLGPSSPGPIVFVVDCPSTSYISSLTSSTSLQSFFSETGKVVNCMIHIGPTSVTGSKAYMSWMENFNVTHHIMARPDVKVLGMPTLFCSAKTLSKLNLVCPWLFPLMKIDAKEDEESAGDHIVSGVNLLKYRLRPLSDLGLDSSEVPEAFDYTATQSKQDTLSAEVLKAHDMALQVWKRWLEEKSATARANRNSENLPACLQEVSREEMELVFLGTGSSQPSKHRNVTGIYIHLFEKGGVLLDCGEGTLAQLKRRYGGEGADEVLLGLKCIWISHLHADHFAGILRILSARRDLLQAQSTDQRILVIGPRKLKSFLDAYGKIEDLAMEFLDCSQTTLEVQRWVESENAGDSAVQNKEGLVDGSAKRASGRSGMQHIWKQPGYHVQHGIDIAGRMRLARVLDLLELKALYSIPVIHCPNAFAVVLEAQERKLSKRKSKPGWKLVFSGDTRPCQSIVEAAYKATILIHESTFEDDLIAEAVKKNHSITQEAIDVGIKADVYRIFLTHFSQRYPSIPCFDSRFSDRACMAFDMMSVNLADLPVVPGFLPALQTLFKDQSDIEDEVEVVMYER